MKKYGFIILVLAIAIYFTGCGKKQKASEESSEIMSMEELGSAVTQQAQTTPAESKAQTAQTSVTTGIPEVKLEPPVPSGPYKPTSQGIQTALKNAGFYTGNIDGKIGPLSKKAIEEFQKANGLKADGKVGPKTWELLSKHLNVAATSAAPTKKR
jgi:peptidoglycan hydrolase-like protein with peptidoglycan-binding domain